MITPENSELLTNIYGRGKGILAQELLNKVNYFAEKVKILSPEIGQNLETAIVSGKLDEIFLEPESFGLNGELSDFPDKFISMLKYSNYQNMEIEIKKLNETIIETDLKKINNYLNKEENLNKVSELASKVKNSEGNLKWYGINNKGVVSALKYVSDDKGLNYYLVWCINLDSGLEGFANLSPEMINKSRDGGSLFFPSGLAKLKINNGDCDINVKTIYDITGGIYIPSLWREDVESTIGQKISYAKPITSNDLFSYSK